MNPLRACLASALLLALASPMAAEGAKVSVTAGPSSAWVFKGERSQRLSFDFVVKNEGEVPLDLESVRMSAFDSNNVLITSRAVDGMGMIPSVKTLPHVEIPPGKSVLEFNPFHELPLGLELKKLRYVFTFSPRGSDEQTKVEVILHPVPLESKTPLTLPVKGKVMLRDGYDLYSHHRRVDMVHPFIVQLEMTHNPNRFGMDFMEVDAQDSTFRDKGVKNEDYFIFGKPVVAPAAGILVDCIDGRPDNPVGKFGVDYAELARTKDRRLLGGNFIILDHGNGEFSFFAHLKQGSLQVKKGDRVTSGQVLAQVGNSGDSFEPHLHYQLQKGPVIGSETLLPLFRNFKRHQGSQATTVQVGEVDTGDIVESK